LHLYNLMSSDIQYKLFDAIIGSDLTSISALLASGADVNGFNDKDETPLIAACRNLKGKEVFAVINLLISNGADINKFSSGGFTALFYAVIERRLLLVQTLLEKGANPNINFFSDKKPMIVSSALDLAFSRYLKTIIYDKKGYFDDFYQAQSELKCNTSMIFLLTEAGARRLEKDVVPEYS